MNLLSLWPESAEVMEGSRTWDGVLFEPRIAMKLKVLSGLTGGLLVLSACMSDSVPPGRILVKNDSQDKRFNVISVSGGGLARSLSPGEKVLLPKGTRNFSVRRQYENFVRAYSVACPPLGSKGLSVKLIDIHLNRIAGGCQTVRAGRE